MNKGNLLKASLVVGFVLSMVAALLKIMHYDGADTWLWVGLLVWAVFVITAVMEVARSRRIPGREKVMWIIGFFAAGLVTGVVYLASGRERIANID